MQQRWRPETQIQDSSWCETSLLCPEIQARTKLGPMTCAITQHSTLYEVGYRAATEMRTSCVSRPK